MLTHVAVLLQTVATAWGQNDVAFVYGNFLQRESYRSYDVVCGAQRPGVPTLDRSVLYARQVREASIAQFPGSPAAWRQLACTRSMLRGSNATADRDELLMRRGMSWPQGAIAAAVQAVRTDSTDAASLELLAMLVFIESPGAPPPPAFHGPSWIARRYDLWWNPAAEESLHAAAATFLRAARAANATAAVLRDCTSLMLDLGNLSGALECSTRALDAGHDSTWHLLRLTWLAFRHADTVAGRMLFDRAVSAAHDRPSRGDLGWHFKVGTDWTHVWGGYMDGGEQDAQHSVPTEERWNWLSLPDSSLMPWIRERTKTPAGRTAWALLDTDAKLAEHFGKLTFIGGTFRDCVSGDVVPPCVRRIDRLGIDAHLLRFWDANGGPIAVIRYVIEGVPTSIGDAAGKPVTNLTLRLRQLDVAGRVLRDTAWRRELRSPRTYADDFGTGLIDVPMPPAMSVWNLTVTSDATDSYGRDLHDHVFRLPTTRLVVSDIALGTPNNGIVWRRGAQAVMLGRTDVFDRREPLHLFYQVRSDSSRDAIVTTLTVSDVTNPRQTVGRLQASSPSPLVRGVTQVERQLDVSRLKRGRYQLEIQVGDRHGDGATVSMTTFTLR